jgi:hypothetical protein
MSIIAKTDRTRTLCDASPGFGFLPGIAIIVVCLTVNQIAYLIGVRLSARGRQDT